MCGPCLSSDLLYRSRAREQSGQKDAKVLTAGACTSMFSNVYVLSALSHNVELSALLIWVEAEKALCFSEMT